MKYIYALAMSLVLVMVTPGLATADRHTRPAANQQFIEYVIARGLSQRGVPFTYGGGDANGPTRGTGSDNDADAGESDAGESIVGLIPAATALASDPAADVVGFDASGLVVYSYAGVGIKLPRSSGEQYKVGRKIAPSQALPGDLIFYGPDGTQSVTMFLGNGQMLETAETGVTVSPVRTKEMTPYLTRIIE